MGHNHIVSVSRLRCERDLGQRLSCLLCPDHIGTVRQSAIESVDSVSKDGPNTAIYVIHYERTKSR